MQRGGIAYLEELLSSMTSSQVFLHLCQGLLVNVVNDRNTNKLASSAEHIQGCDQPAKLAGSFSGLTNGTQSRNIADQGGAHEGNDSSGTKIYCKTDKKSWKKNGITAEL